ncbi:MAG: PIN/TRAM domain-containing protein [Planctomycetaceae bacterium]|nr:PIN/TRAM domain-containing protein [Planctomycetaceae bacterium]
MLLLVVRLLYVFVCAGAIATFVNPAASTARPTFVDDHPIATFVGLMILSQVVTAADVFIRRKRIEVISAIYFGLLVGVLLSYLLIQALEPIMRTADVRNAVVMMTTLILPYLCISLLLQTKDDFRFVIPYVEFAKEVKGGKPLVLDSSALIDGRIADIIDTNIIDSPMLVPQFVLHEVQDIADSNDKARRTRGRRGLEVLSKLQNHPNVDIRVHETKKDEFRGMTVDQRLVELAKQLGGRVVTNDFNLNKVASLQGIPVINLNDVANALKPRFVPGDRLKIKIIKEGESAAQGVGYLDDGTMVVCESAAHLVGRDIDVIVTSMLQSSAGRMIFGRQVFPSGSSAASPSPTTTS